MTTTYAIQIDSPGGPDCLHWRQVDLAEPAPGEVRIRHTAVGLNFIDVYHRTGLYPAPTPFTPGLEGAGEVLACGDGVRNLSPGDRVAYAGPPLGAYAVERNMPADRLVPLPDSIGDREAAALMLQGLTAQYLLRRTYRVKAGQTILLHAAAGGVGLLACQWAKSLGVRVIGTVGSDDKAALAEANGCAVAINTRREDFVARVRELTDGAGVPVVYDSVGADTFSGSLDCLQPLGMMVSFGQSSGSIPPQDLAIFAGKGSLFFTRPTLMTYAAAAADMRAMAAELFGVVAGGAVKARLNQTYSLADAAQAHRDLEARKTTGSTVLLP